MAIRHSDDGSGQILTSYYNKVQPVGGNNHTLRLFVNNVTPAADGSDTAATYTEAAAGHGYAAVTLTAGSWTISKVGGINQAAYAKQTFTWTSNPSETVYGYYVLDADGVLILSERDPDPFTPTLNGDFYEVTVIDKASGGTPA